MKPDLFLKFAALVMAIMAFSPQAPAFGQKQIETLEKKIYKENILRPEEIKDCVILERDIQKVESLLKKERELLVAEEKGIAMNRDEILELKKNLNLQDGEEVQNFNKRIKEFNSRREQYNASAGAYSEKADKLTVMNEKYNTQCASKTYYEEDYKATLKKLDGK
ncbi:MAG: hypothetical protein OEZ55_04010 [Nitrospinota bacterium]|nr:hypothetical protein [Nitrospinota bacterium]